MATSNNNIQNVILSSSQSFHTQSIQNADAETPPLAHVIANDQNGQGSQSAQSATAPVMKHGRIPAVNATELRSLNEENLHHRLNASGSVQAIAVDEDLVFAGLQDGEIVVSTAT